jgi:signal transduction histidine kinase
LRPPDCTTGTYQRALYGQFLWWLPHWLIVPRPVGEGTHRAYRIRVLPGYDGVILQSDDTWQWDRYGFVMRTWARANPTKTDGLVATLLFLVAFVGPNIGGATVANAPVFLSGCLSFLPLAWIRRWTVPVALIVTAATAYMSANGQINQLGLLWALFVVGWKLGGRRLYLTAAAMIFLITGVFLLELERFDLGNVSILVGAMLLFTMPVLFGRMFANMGERNAAAKRELELRLELQQRATEQAGSDERARLARELHDAVAHSMSVVVLHAAGAKRALDSSPDVAHASLQIIEETARSSLVEMRRLVSAMRSGHSDVGGLTPRAGIREIDDMIRAHPHSTLEIRGELPVPSPIIDSSVYRIVQESLTNARRHAPGAPVGVVIENLDSYVHVCVRNPISQTPGGAHAELQPGFGLVGMAERVFAVGGTLRTGLNECGEWEVLAELPLREAL